MMQIKNSIGWRASALGLGTLALLCAEPAFAAATTFSGLDDGAAVGGPYTNATAAQASFLSAASVFGSVTTDGFEDAAVGYYSPVSIGGGAGSIAFGSGNYGTGYSGVNNTTAGNLYGFNTTAGGSHWLGAPEVGTASLTFSFGNGTNSLGFWLTGVQSSFTSSVVLTQLDGSAQTFTIPFTVNGGASFFGVVDSNAFVSATLSLANSGDAWGIDDVSFNAGTSPAPEPASWALMLAGFGAVGAGLRRRRARVAIA